MVHLDDIFKRYSNVLEIENKKRPAEEETLVVATFIKSVLPLK